MKSIIFHIDVNSAFLSWEAVFRLKHRGGTLDLRQIPAAVGGDMTMRHGIILAKSIPAGKYGVRTGESIPEAKKKCPNLMLVPPNYSLYERCSVAFMSILREYSDVVEQYSIDEAFVDMSTTCHLFGTPEETAGQIRERICQELGFTVNIGISENKLLAKMASDFRKPNRVHTLYAHEIREKMWPLPVSDLFFVGRATAKRLLDLGIRTIGELAQADPVMLRDYLKKQGEVIWGFAHGIDCSPVLSEAPANKGYGNSTTAPFDVTDRENAEKILLALAETVGTRLRQDNVQIEIVAVGIRFTDLSYVSHRKILSSSTNITGEIYRAACELFRELWNGAAIRHLGIHTCRVQSGEFARQLSLFDEVDYGKLMKADETMDNIRSRYGIDSVKRVVFLNQPIDHMCGGISREKREVDYSKLRIE
ncbi:MAG: DNA polymerase IV [Acetatifactor sp.]